MGLSFVLLVGRFRKLPYFLRFGFGLRGRFLGDERLFLAVSAEKNGTNG